jgi:hypothetical protein
LGSFTGTVSFGTNDPAVGAFEFTLSGTVAASQVRIIDDGSAGYNPGGFLAGSKVEGFGGDVDYSFAHSTRTASWNFSNLPAGTYQVAATWSPAYNRATNAPYHINGGSAIRVNQRAHPRDFHADGARWEVLGEVPVTTSTPTTADGSIQVTLTADGIGSNLVIADAVRIVPVSSRVIDEVGEFAVVDNGELGFDGDSNGVSTWGQTVGVTSYDGEYAYLTGDNNGHEATWTFSVIPGATYQVASIWQWASYNRATNAPFKIEAGTAVDDVTVNQTLAPSLDQSGTGLATVNGRTFQVLTNNFVVPSGENELTVSVTDNANSYVILDAVMVRLVTLPPLLAEGGAAPTSADVAPLSGEQIEPLVAEAIARWSAAGLDEAQLEELQSAEVKIVDLPGAALGNASELANTIWIDLDAAGYGWFVDGTPALDEEFALTLTAGELEAVDGDAAEGMDLLTVLSHELGHLLGLEDLDPHTHDHDLMAATLATGIRRLPAAESDELATGSEAASEEQLSDDSGSQTGGPSLAATAASELSKHDVRDAFFAQLGAAVSFRSHRFADEEVEDSREDPDSREESGWLLLAVR